MAEESDHYSSLTRELKCSCGGYLKPPIKLCAQGHGVCKKCWRTQQTCSICQDVFTETRSIALEALVDKLQFPCPHNGCSVKIPLKDLDEHASECNMRPTPCFMAKVYPEGCDWVGMASDWLDHCVKNHPEHVTDSSEICFSEMWSPKNKSPIMRYHLLRCYEKVFNVYQIYDTKSGKMMWSIVMTGASMDDNSTFFFDLDIYNPNDFTRRINFRQPCKNGTDLDILDSNQNVLLPLEQIIYMLDSKKFIHYKITVVSSEKYKEADENHQNTIEPLENGVKTDLYDIVE